MADLSSFRKTYEKGSLSENETPDNPFSLFEQWFEVAVSNNKYEANAMTLATSNVNGLPRARVVLLKSFDESGFVFFTNFDSAKGKAIAENPNVCLSFFWQDQERQVIIEGVAAKIDKQISESYFRTRPRQSQLGALASAQSTVTTEADLQANFDALNARYPNEVPMPENWGGYLVEPRKIEFWQGRPSRLHDRIVFEQEDAGWKRYRVAP